jgi:hypothetical protein
MEEDGRGRKEEKKKGRERKRGRQREREREIGRKRKERKEKRRKEGGREERRKEKPGAGAHNCNPSHSGGRDQEDCSSKLTWANSSQDPISKKTHHKKWAGRVAQGVVSELKPQ